MRCGAPLQAPPLDDPDALWTHELIGAVGGLGGRGDPRPGGRGRVEPGQRSAGAGGRVGLFPLRFVTEHRGGRVTVDIPPGLLDV